MQDANPQPKADLSFMEEELQNELRNMFELDTQTYLQTYEQVTEQLSSETWTADIQELYRAIHTIKGGAVTVGADAVLATTTALEEMLSDLRYLQSAPPLQDGALSAVLVEAGEVVSGSLLIGAEEEETGQAALTSALNRLKALHEQVKEKFLNEIDEHQQLCQDFANQGFDLMVLDLEMALEQIPEAAQVPPSLVDTAAQVFTTLETVGKDLEMGQSWSLLLQPLFELLIELDSSLWRSRSQCYLQLLKDCALEGGALTADAQAQLEQDGFSSQGVEPTPIAQPQTHPSIDLADFIEIDPEETYDHNITEPALDFLLNDADFESNNESELQVADNLEEPLDEMSLDLGWLTDTSITELEPTEINSGVLDITKTDIAALDTADHEIDLETVSIGTESIETPAIPKDLQATSDLGSESAPQPGLIEEESFHTSDPNAESLVREGQLLSQALKQIETTQQPLSDSEELDELIVPEDFLETLNATAQAPDVTGELPTWLIEPAEQQSFPSNPKDTVVQQEPSTQNRHTQIPKIPVPLDRLDRSARALVEILLSARATQGRYQSLQNQVAQIVQLSQESAAYITQLRQMQDDYALLRDLTHQASDSNGVQLEGYRSGYTAINRLLENSLRLSEIGAEAAATAQATKQEFNQLNLNIKMLQGSVEASRLISFKSVAFRLRAIIRDLINRMGKPVNFVIEGESQNIDAGTIQVLEPALLHLLRNAYDHGIEVTETRLKCGKPEVATITLSLKRQGSSYHLSLVDDGGGIDRNKISEIAQTKELPLSQTETNAQLLQVISQPGFSSQSEVSAVSGRGVGMDVVKHQVQSVGGTLQLSTQLGQGSQFDIKIPVPHLLVPCIVLKAGPQYFAIPTDAIQTMRLWDDTCAEVKNPMHPTLQWEREFEGRMEPMMPIMAYWQDRLTDNLPANRETAICLRISGRGGEAIWLMIDDLVEELDLLISSLPSPLKAPTGMMGLSALPTGEMIPVLEAGAIAQMILNPNYDPLQHTILAQTETDTDTSDQTQNANLILVVDDAALLRRRLEISLVNYGYEVYCCRDGLEAWNWLQENPTPGLMITDIEMPQMDGLTLVDRCRQSGQTFPILVSSSRLSEEWSKEAQRVGANDYLTKGFSTNDLIDVVSRLMATPIPS